MTLSQILFVGFGGFLGSISRFVTVKSVDERFLSNFPYGTITVNLLGSLILGFVYALMARKAGPNHNWMLFLSAGFCGGFTTFSAFALENFNLIHARPVASLIYILASVTGGVLAVALGYFTGKSL
jgi:fluoride exporter